MNSLFLKFLLSFVALLMLTAALISVTLFQIFSNSSIRQIDQISGKTLIQQQNSAEFILNQAKSICAQLAFDNDVVRLINSSNDDSLTQSTVINRLKDLTTINSSLYSICIYNSLSSSFYSTDYPNVDTDAITLLSNSGEKLNFRVVPRIIKSERNNEHKVYSIFYYVKDRETNTVLNAIIVNVKFEALQKMNDGSQKSDNSENILAVDQNGRVMFSWYEDDFLKDYSGKKQIQSLLSSESNPAGNRLIKNETISGEKAIISSSFSSRLGWHFIYIIPYSKAMLGINTLKNNIILICILVLILGIFTSAVISGRLTAPFSRLVKTILGTSGTTEYQDVKLSETEFLSNFYLDIIKKVSNLEKIRQSSYNRIKWEYLSEVLQGLKSPDRDEMQDLGISLSGYAGTVAVILNICIPEDGAALEASGLYETARKKVTFGVSEIAGSFLKEHFRFEDTQVENNPVFILDIPEKCTIQHDVIPVLQQIRDRIGELFNISLNIAVGTFEDNYASLSQSYKNAKNVLNYRIVYEKGTILLYETVLAARTWDYDYPYKKEKALLEAIKTGEKDQILPILDSLFDSMKYYYYDFILLSVYHLWFSTFITVKLLLNSDMSNIPDKYEKILQKIRNSDNLDDLRAWFTEYLFTSLLKVKEGRNTQNSSLANEIEAFVLSNYCSADLSIEVVAEKFHYNAIYFGKLFKELFNMSFIDYVVKLRLEKSIEYLEDSKMAVKQISMKIGFNNPTYFVTWFKKNTGYSPSEYRNRFFPAN